MLILRHQQQTPFENIVRKGEIARNEQFLLFPQCFLVKQIIVYPLFHIFAIISLFAAELEDSKIGISSKGLNISWSVDRSVSQGISQSISEQVRPRSMYHCTKGRRPL